MKSLERFKISRELHRLSTSIFFSLETFTTAHHRNSISKMSS